MNKQELLPHSDCKTIEQKYEELRKQVVWAVTHYGVVNTKVIFEVLRNTVISLDRL